VPPKRAAAMNFQGKELKTFKVDADAVLIDMRVYELLPLLVRITEPDGLKTVCAIEAQTGNP
jgi:hypothetical protein